MLQCPDTNNNNNNNNSNHHYKYSTKFPRSRTFQTNNTSILAYAERSRLNFLPTTISLCNGTKAKIDYLTDEQFRETFQMVQQASEDGTGFCIDEYPEYEVFHDELRYGDFFGITNLETGELMAAFLLAVSKYYRGWRVADSFIIVKKSVRRQRLGELCMRLACDYAQKIGYLGMYVDLFSNNEAMIRILKTIGGFEKVGFLPMAGQCKHAGLLSGYIYFRDFQIL